jgi:hypothetical protein
MRGAGKLQAQTVIDSLVTEGSTNLIAANKLALSSALADTASSNIHIVILTGPLVIPNKTLCEINVAFLTDGEPDDAQRVLPEFCKVLIPLEVARASGKAPYIHTNQPQTQPLTVHQVAITERASALLGSVTT